MKTGHRLIAASFLLATTSGAYAQIAVSANDGDALRPGEPISARTQDSVAVIDMRRYPPRVVGSVAAPAALVGAPTAVAVSRDGKLALVTASRVPDAAGELVPGEHVSVIDISKPSAPKLVQTVKAGPGVVGVSINRRGTLALVASGNDTISVFTIKGRRLTPAGTVQLEAKSRPSDVVIAPDGKSAVVVAAGLGTLVKLDIEGAKVSVANTVSNPGSGPYGAVISPDGRFAYNANLGGRPRAAGAPAPAPGSVVIGTISATNLSTGEVASVEVGQTPEHIAMSPDGAYVAVVVANGSAAAPDAPGYHPYGLLQIYRAQGLSLTKVAEAQTGAWCQSAVFSNDNRTLLLQCSMQKQVETYRFDGKSLTRDAAATLQFDARPASMGTPTSR